MLDDWRDLPDVLIPDDNSLRILASCYLVCRDHFDEMSNALRNDASLSNRYENLRKEFSGMLVKSRTVYVPLLQPDTMNALTRQLRAASPLDALVRCAALLRALSLYIGNQHRGAALPGPVTALPSPVFGSEKILISIRRRSAIADSLERLPRLESDISDMLDNYHPELHLTTVKVGNWSILSCPLSLATAELFAARVKKRQVKIAVSPLTLDASLQGRSLPDSPRTSARDPCSIRSAMKRPRSHRSASF